jgi:hypothetical protein
MVFRTLKGLFGGGDTPEAPAAEAPFGLDVGRAVTLDVMRYRLEAERLAVPVPAETLVVSAHGTASMDGDGILHRFYDDSNTMLQVLCVGGVSDDSIREITLYVPWDEVVPASPAEWARWDGPGAAIGAAVFEADGFNFQRVWGEPSTPWISPAEFVEDIRSADGTKRSIHQKLVPYRRQVGPLIETLVISIERDIASQDRGSVSFMIGYGLARADVEPV